LIQENTGFTAQTCFVVKDSKSKKKKKKKIIREEKQEEIGRGTLG
jgi:hypothetical protein